MRQLALVCALMGFLVPEIQCYCDYKPKDGQYVLCATQPRTVEVGHNTSLKIRTDPPLRDNVYLNVSVDHRHIIEVPNQARFGALSSLFPGFTNQKNGNKARIYHVQLVGGPNTTHTYITLRGRSAGIATVSFTRADNSTSFYKLDKVQREVSIIHATWIYYFSMVVGWIYFAAWSISFYPQIIENFRRRSVVGLNFDYLALNITGFITYGVFNVGLFWIPRVKEEYKDLHPGGVNPVQINDVVFTLHAIAATGFTIFQCFIFERGKQRVSVLTWVMLALLWLVVIISLFVAVGGKLSWLNFLYVFSYVKLVITLIKYIPQVVMNCRRRSTVGWSIGNVLLDFTGGAFSILQMFLISYNYDDWKSIFGDPTKFGLGLFSILFDVVFMFQHYVLFRGKQPREETPLCWSKTVHDAGIETDDSNEKTPLINTSQKKKGAVCYREKLQRVINFCV